MKSYAPYLLVISLVVCLLSAHTQGYGQPRRDGNVKTLVIDPGHGGQDPGCVYGGVKEKDIALAVGLLFGEMVNKNLPDVKVLYTRKTDVFVELDKRGKVANDANADLFVSIHVNATANGSSASGSMTLVMGTNDIDRNLNIAMRENDVILYEKDYQTRYEGYVPGSPESYIIFSLMQYAFQEQSINFAGIVQKHYGKNTPIPINRGVRQQPLIVLRTSAMPSVLTELGFLTNPTERRYMASAAGQKALARSLFNAFSEYKSSIEGTSKAIILTEDSPVEDTVRTNTPSMETEQASAGENPASDAVTEDTTLFSVQVMASGKKVDTSKDPLFRAYRNRVTERKIGGLYKYYIGAEPSFPQAAELQKELGKAFKGAFVVAFKGDKQLVITDDMKK